MLEFAPVTVTLEPLLTEGAGMSVDRDRLARIIVSGIRDIEEWRLGDPALAEAKRYPREYPAELLDDFGMLFIDLTIDARDGSLVCHEVNGPNAVGSDALTGDSTHRADNEARQALRRAKEIRLSQARRIVRQASRDRSCAPALAVLSAPAVSSFRASPGLATFLQNCFREMRSAPIPRPMLWAMRMSRSLMGDVPAVCANIEVNPENGMFEYRGRPIVFMGNPNLIPELERIGRVSHLCRTSGEVNLRPMHAWRLCGLVHDKARQQESFRKYRDQAAPEICGGFGRGGAGEIEGDAQRRAGRAQAQRYQWRLWCLRYRARHERCRHFSNPSKR